MAKTFFLHAGPPKTGSTAIQEFFRDNAAVFARHGLFRPLTGTEHRSHYHFDLVEAFRPGSSTRPLLARLSQEIEAHGRPERVFISAEHFSHRLSDPGYLAALTGFCSNLGYRLHVIAYARPHAALLNSLYTQNVKSWRPVPPIDAFVTREIQSGRHDYLHHFAALRNLKEADVTLRPFSRAVLKRGLTVDICAVMGLDMTGETLVAAEEDKNASPGPMTVAAFERLRRRINRDHPDLSREALAPLTWPLLRAAGALGWNAEKYGGISTAVHTMIERSFAKSNAEVARLHWSKDWADVFTEADLSPTPYNVFDPAIANPPARRAFRDFIEQSAEAIAEIAALHQDQGRRK
ncbi:hypothetical protein [Aestuariivirga sp.]|uniref:hypothetical protein n=1 Tax=Aestuariivirga sp. TaxID=2650926 RepID=UPI00359372E2